MNTPGSIKALLNTASSNILHQDPEMYGLLGQVELAIVHHCKMHKLHMNKHERSSRDEHNQKVSNRYQDFVHLMIENFTQHEDPPLVTHILECASTYEPPCKDDKKLPVEQCFGTWCTSYGQRSNAGWKLVVSQGTICQVGGVNRHGVRTIALPQAIVTLSQT